MALFNWFELRPWRRSSAEHWTQRARLLADARGARTIQLWLIPALVCLVNASLVRHAPWAGVLVSAVAGTLLGSYPMDRETLDGLGFRPWLREVFAALCYRLAGVGWVAVCALLMPQEFNLWTLMLTALFWLGQYALMAGLLFQLLRLIGTIRPASPKLSALVDRANESVRAQIRRVEMLHVSAANALAHPLTGDVFFTPKTLQVLSDEEIVAVAAHELGHLKENRTTIASRVITSSMLFPFIFARPIYAEWGGQGLAVLACAGAGIFLFQRTVTRNAEPPADNAAITAQPATFAHALEKLHVANLAPAVSGHRYAATHPELYDRMIKAGVTPDYPRPKPPSGHSFTVVAMALLVVFFGIGVFLSP